MDKIPKFDVSKITGAYQLLAVFLLIIEVFIGSWFYRAENPTERIFAGFFMTVIFLAFLYVVINIKREESSKPIFPPGLGSVTPAKEEDTEKEIEFPEPQRIGSPDGSYGINKPPDDWIVQELSSEEWLNEGYRITDPSIKEKIFGKSPQVHEILSLKSKREISVIPISGKTIIDGRKLPSACVISIPIRLGIMPIDRIQPPLFVERSFEHNFLLNICEAPALFKVSTLHNISLGTVPNSQLRYIQTDFRQEIRDAIVNDKEGKNVDSNIIIIGIEGEIRDYILLMNYPSVPEANDPDLERDLQTLQSLVSSFRPLKTINPEDKRMQIKQLADQKFTEYINENGKDLFVEEFRLTLLRLSGLNMDDPEQRLKATKMLKPFEIFAKEINLQDEDLNPFWNSLREAEKGNAANFKSQLNEIIEVIKGEKKNSKAISPAKKLKKTTPKK